MPKLSLFPDFGYKSTPASCDVLPAGTKLVRVYNTNHTKPPRSTLDFNPKVIEPDDPAYRARFSSTILDKYAVLYVAEQVNQKDPTIPDVTVAVWEMVDHLGLGYLGGKGYFYNELMFPTDLAFRYFETTEPLKVVNIRNQRDAGAFRADWEHGLSGENYTNTRAWARYIRREIPDADGLRYTSKRLGSYVNSPIVLFEELPHTTSRRAKMNPRKVRALGMPVALNGPKGRELVTRAFAVTDDVFVP